MEMEYEHEGVILEDAVSIDDLLHKGGRFQINTKHMLDREDDNLFMPGDADFKPSTDDTIISPWLQPFDKLLTLMKPLPAPHDKIYKKIVCESKTKESVGQTNCRVTIHYNAYWENEAQPFDSTYQHRQPTVFIIGKQEVLPGIELAVRSMLKGEESQFVIPYELLFGEHGCPNRIKPRANGLFIIQLLEITDVGDENALETISKADRNKYAVVQLKVQDIFLTAKDALVRGDIHKACRLFHKAVNALEFCTLVDETEQTKQRKLLVRLYTSLAVCYTKLNLPRKTCSMCNEIARISDINDNCKALYHRGKALLTLGDFHEAGKWLLRAQQHQPHNKEITTELNLLEKKFCENQKFEREIWKRAFGHVVSSANPDTTTMDELNLKFRANTIKYLKEFEANTELVRMQLPAGLSKPEVDCVEELIKDMDLKLEVTGFEEKPYILHKCMRKN